MTTPVFLMLVDDETSFIETMTKRLKKREFTVISALSGTEALKLLRSHQNLDVILLDVKMPGMDGIATLQEIKKSYPLLEVIMLTGHGTIETAVEGMKLGAYDYLLKPADVDEISAKLEGARKRKDEQEDRIRKAEQRSLLRRGGNI